MAKKKEEAKLERVYTVPLRKEYQKVPRWRRTKKAVKALQEFLAKHMKSDNVKISSELNDELWKHGIKNPPHHVKVTVTKDKDGVVKAELFGEKKGKKTEKKVEKKEEVKDVPKGVKTEEAVKEVHEEKSEEVPVEQ
ncbi:50S ribosomal protein L31e [Candidatus Woesearchaeota archaeon CG10_big_fil_rev_8_21_14_0_10_36_11]|nr:MAG: 50S ribosomal protein L31e [Candidatus Woesearchaeota archaeon CG10_big_fil_rev_8_21_14_0_10_36_11]